MVDLVTRFLNYLVVDMVVVVIAALFTNGLYGVILIIDASVAVVPSSISPPILVTGGALEALGLTRIVLSLPF